MTAVKFEYNLKHKYKNKGFGHTRSVNRVLNECSEKEGGKKVALLQKVLDSEGEISDQLHPPNSI